MWIMNGKTLFNLIEGIEIEIMPEYSPLAAYSHRIQYYKPVGGYNEDTMGHVRILYNGTLEECQSVFETLTDRLIGEIQIFVPRTGTPRGQQESPIVIPL